ncbi:hypothetical protein JX266_012861 [Neoarthrinium moseri]|nr:hypothetical protein JX266_012861 [Neoarthrinium moseri]
MAGAADNCARHLPAARAVSSQRQQTLSRAFSFVAANNGTSGVLRAAVVCRRDWTLFSKARRMVNLVMRYPPTPHNTTRPGVQRVPFCALPPALSTIEQRANAAEGPAMCLNLKSGSDGEDPGRRALIGRAADELHRGRPQSTLHRHCVAARNFVLSLWSVPWYSASPLPTYTAFSAYGSPQPQSANGRQVSNPHV